MKRRKHKMSVQGIELRRWLGNGWIVEANGMLIAKRENKWCVSSRVGAGDNIASGRTIAEAIENATTVWECPTCKAIHRGAEDHRRLYHPLCPGIKDGTLRQHWALKEAPLLYAPKIRYGLRVEEVGLLGKGTAMHFIGQGDIMVMVKWDKTPPARYNMSTNPCTVFTSDLKRAEWEMK